MKKAALLYPLFIPNTPWEEISIDVIEPLLRSEDKDIILVVVDWFSKMIRPMAMTTSISSSEVARIYQDDVRPEIYSGLKLNKFCDFIPQNQD